MLIYDVSFGLVKKFHVLRIKLF